MAGALCLALVAPAGATTLAARADEAYAEGRFKRAADLYLAAVRRDPSDAWVHLRLAFAWRALGEADKSAIAAAEAATDPRLLAALPAIVEERAARGRYGEALVAALELLRRAPRDCGRLRTAASLAAAAGDAAGSEALLDRGSAACPDHPGLLVDLGQNLLARGCASQAVSALERAVSVVPADETARAALAAARSAVSRAWADTDATLAALEREVGLAVGSPGGLASPALGRRWRDAYFPLAAGEDGEAAVDPELALRAAEYWRLGAELGVDGAEERALASARRAAALRPTSAEALTLLGTLELTRAEPDPAEAERLFLSALALDDGRPLAGAWSGLFFAQLELGRERAALDAGKRYAELVPDDLEFRSLLEDLAGRRRGRRGARP